MSREDPQFKLRMTDALRDRIAEAAKVNGRSMNAELIARLEASFEASPDAINASLDAKFEELQKGLKRLETLMVPGSTEAKPKRTRPAK